METKQRPPHRYRTPRPVGFYAGNKYPFKTPWILVSVLIDFIADQCYADDRESSRKKLRNNIRSRIYQASGRGRFSIQNRKVLATEFFDWALTSWRELATIQNLPQNPMKASATLPIIHASGLLISIPSDPATYEKSYIASEVGRYRLVETNLNQKNKIEALTNEVNDLRAHQEAVSRVRSKAGKRGGRGRGAPE